MIVKFGLQMKTGRPTLRAASIGLGPMIQEESFDSVLSAVFITFQRLCHEKAPPASVIAPPCVSAVALLRQHNSSAEKRGSRLPDVSLEITNVRPKKRTRLILSRMPRWLFGYMHESTKVYYRLRVSFSICENSPRAASTDCLACPKDWRVAITSS